jgi:hypothetical protein
MQLGLRPGFAERVLAALALIKMGTAPEAVSSLLTWSEFEEFCAGILEATGYSVKRNIVITKPRRQIDIFARSSQMGLSVDCKHWGKGLSGSALERIARQQVERTVLYKGKFKLDIPVLPVILTLIDAPSRLVRGVPVVPIFALRDFLTSVNQYETELDVV